MTGKSCLLFAKILGIAHVQPLKRLSRGTNPALYYRDRLIELGYTPLEIADWHSFFETRIPAKFRKKAPQKPFKRIRSIPVKEPLNLDLTPLQIEQINRMSNLKRSRIAFIFSAIKKAQKAGVLDAGASNRELRKIIEEPFSSGGKLSHQQYKNIVNKIRDFGLQNYIDGWAAKGCGKVGKTKINPDDLALFAQAYMHDGKPSVQMAYDIMLNGRDFRLFASPAAFLYQLGKKSTQSRRLPPPVKARAATNRHTADLSRTQTKAYYPASAGLATLCASILW